MADIVRHDGTGTDIIQKTPELREHQLRIQISEKLNFIKQLGVQLERIEHVEVEQIKLRMATLQKEAEGLKVDLAKQVEVRKLN